MYPNGVYNARMRLRNETNNKHSMPTSHYKLVFCFIHSNIITLFPKGGYCFGRIGLSVQQRPLVPNVVYKYKYLHDANNTYSSKTMRHLATRVKEHGTENPDIDPVDVRETELKKREETLLRKEAELNK